MNLRNIAKELASLSPERRVLLERLLRSKGIDPAHLPILPRTGDSNTAPLSFAQQRLWFLDQLEPDNLAYTMIAAVRMIGSLQPAALQQSLDEVARRQQILRTTFVRVDQHAAAAQDQQPLQVIQDDCLLPLTQIDLRQHPRSSQDTEVQRLIDAQIQQPFDLATGPLVRASLLFLADEEHLFLVTMHHIISDRWSMGVFFREIFTCYQTFARRPAGGVSSDQPALPALPIQYADFAVWQRQQLSGEQIQQQIGYWKEQLAGIPALLNLPTDHPRPGIQGTRGARQRIVLTQSMQQALLQISQQSQTTLFMVMLAAFKTLLYRYSGQSDIVVGTPAAGRNRVEIEGLIGCFVNTLVLRSDLGHNPTFHALLQQLRSRVLDAQAQQDVPFEKLVEELHIERSLSHNPIFQVMFAFQNVPLPELGQPDLRLEIVNVEQKTAQFDLTLIVEEAADGLAVSLEYNLDLFEHDTADRMLGHFQTLLAGIVADPERRILDLPLLTEAEQQRLLAREQTRFSEMQPERCLHELFEAQARQRPTDTALVLDDESLTYQDLNRQANQLAHHLRSLGVGPETRVGLCVERSIMMVVGLLAILKAGGCYVPLDPAYPADRLQFLLEDANVAVLLTQQRLSEALPPCHGRVVLLDADWPTIAAQRESNLSTPVDPQNSAYIIYTSGSTGRPKGVCVAHGPASQHCVAIQPVFELSPSDRVLQFASLSFDVSIEQILPPLSIGATVVLRGPELLGAIEFDRFVGEQQLTVVNVPPAYWNQWTHARLNGPAMPLDLLRLVIVGGDVLAPEALRRWRQTMPESVRLLNAYGPTETLITASAFSVPTTDDAATRNIPIGRGIGNRTLYVLDVCGNLLPAGIPGELYLGGMQARGYLNHPDLTAERFVPDPFSEVPGARLYRTGDLVRSLPDGTITFLGRLDNQIKIRGFRIELGEIEVMLAQHPALREAIVVVREHEPSAGGHAEKRIVAYVVPHEAETVQATDLRTFAQQHLPEYMVPTAFVVLEKLPLLTSGKVDRNALPAPTYNQPEAHNTYITPRTPNEHILAQIWAEVLRLPRVGIHDNFFALGGESILSIQIVTRANQAGLRLTPRQLFQYQTIAELAPVAQRTSANAEEQSPVVGDVVLTPIQRWFFEQHFAEQNHWNQSVLVEARQPLDLALVKQTFQHLLRHHDALRLRFAQAAAGWQQTIIAPDDDVSVNSIDLAAYPEAQQQAAFAAAAEQLQASLDISAGPILRAALFDFGASRPQRLLIVIHHLAVDGVSWRILLDDVQSIYAQLQAGATVKLPAKSTSFARWASRQADYAQTEAVRRELDYWTAEARTRSKSLPVDLWPADAPNTVGSSRTVALSLSAEETRALLQQIPSAYRTQINEILLTALALAFAKRMDLRTFLVDLEGHGRETIADDIDISRTIGWFTTQFPVLLEVGESVDLMATLKTIKEQIRQIPNHGFGYGLLRYFDDAAGDLRSLPQAEVSFNYLGQFDQALTETALFALVQGDNGPERSPLAQRAHLIEIIAFVADGRLHMSWTYSQDRHRQDTIEALAQDFSAALQELIAQSGRPQPQSYTPSDFPQARLTQAALDQILGTDQGIVDAYLMAPAQQGMLFHSLYAPESGVYIEQLICELRGSFDATAFQQAWQSAMQRHPIMRTSFMWEELDTPHQVVHQQVALPVEEHNWQDLAAAEQQQRLEQLLQADRTRGFDFSRPPLMRLFLIQTTAQTYEFVWSIHHILMDGWCLPIIMTEVFTAYESFRQGREPMLAPARPYRDYIAWLQQQDTHAAEAYWRQALKGFTQPTVLGCDRAPGSKPEPGEQHTERRVLVPETATSALQALGQQQNLTLNTLVQGMWALLLSHYSGAQDVLFGITVSGRPADMANVDTMVGLFINTLPLRVKLPTDAPLLQWLQEFQLQIAEARQYEHSPLVQVQSWSDVPRGVSLFETIVVFAQYPMDTALADHQRQAQTLEIAAVRGIEQTNYPLTLTAVPGATLALDLNYSCRRFTSATIEHMANHLEHLVQLVLAQPNGSISSFIAALAALDREQARIRQQERKQTQIQRLKQTERKTMRTSLPKGDDRL